MASQMGSSTRNTGGSYIYPRLQGRGGEPGAENLATDLKTAGGIAVGVYHPGWVRTDMGGGAAEIGTEEGGHGGLVARFDALTLGSTGCFRDLGWSAARLLREVSPPAAAIRRGDAVPPDPPAVFAER